MWNLAPLPRNLDAARRDLSDKKPEVRLSAVRDLGRLAAAGTNEAGAALIGALSDASPRVRAGVLVALADAEVKTAADKLLPLLSDADDLVREMALMAIGELCEEQDEAALAAIVRALDAELPQVRFQALIAYARLGRERALPILTHATKDGDARVRYVALRTLEERLSSEQDEAARARALEAADAGLGDSSAEVRLAAAILLAKTGSTRAHDVLVATVNARRAAREPEDEERAVELSGELGLAEARPGLARRAFGRIWGRDRFAFQARVALARLGDPRARQSILQDLRSWSFETRTMAVAAAGRAQLAEAHSAISEMRQDARRADPEAVREALALLAREGP